jgi:hypothetical protein
MSRPVPTGGRCRLGGCRLVVEDGQVKLPQALRVGEDVYGDDPSGS